MEWLAKAFELLLGKFAALVEWFAELFKQVFKDLWEMGTDAVCWVLEGMLDLVAQAVEAVNLGPITENLGAWGSIPANVMEVLSALGVGTALGIVATAIGVRLVLQLIPFTRLGS